MKYNRNFYILLFNLAIISYLLAGLPKFFSILSPMFSHMFSISKAQFDGYLYQATFYSLFGKIFFSFVINSKKFNQFISIYCLFILMILIHGFSMVMTLFTNLNIHIFARYLQGFSAGVLTVLLEPIIFNCSEDSWRNKLLFLKYELIALLTPVAILVTSLLSQSWQNTLIILAVISVVSGFGVLFCKSSNNYYVQQQNDLLSINGFFQCLMNPVVILENIIMGGFLGLFLVMAQNHFYHIFSTVSSSFIKGLIQGLPFSISFILANTKWRSWGKNFCPWGILIGLLGFIILQIINHKGIMAHGFLSLTVISLYIFYVLFMPEMLSNLLTIKPNHISHRSMSTASQLLRSLSTLVICNGLNNIYKYNCSDMHLYYYLLFIYCFTNIVLLKFQSKKKKTSIISLVLSIGSLIVLMVFCYYCHII